MTGFTLGNTSGATLGNSSGGTLGTAPTAYVLGGKAIPALVDEVATYRTLTLTLRVTNAVLLDRVRRAKTDENQIDVLTTDTGGYVAVDRAGGDNTFSFTPPESRQPLRREGTVYVRRYEEDLVSQSVDEWTVELELVRDANRTDQPTLDVQEQTPDPGTDSGFTLGNSSGATLGNASGGTLGNYAGDRRPRDWWGIETRYGTIVTPRVVSEEFIGTGAKGVERFEVVMHLTFPQTHLFEAALARLDGVRVRERADTANIPVDDTSDSANTLTIASPTPDTVQSGDYVAMSWESRRLNDEFAEVSLVMAQKR